MRNKRKEQSKRPFRVSSRNSACSANEIFASSRYDNCILGAATLTCKGGGSLTTSGSPTAYVSLPASTKWAIRIESTLSPNQAAGVTTTVEIAVDVQ